MRIQFDLVLIFVVKCKTSIFNLNLCHRESPEEDKKDDGDENKTDDSKAEPPKKVWNQANFTAEYRKFNIDMTPKVRWYIY